MSTEEGFPNREGTLQVVCSASKMSARKWLKERRRWTCRRETEVEMVTMMGISPRRNAGRARIGSKYSPGSGICDEESKSARMSRWMNCPMKSGPPKGRGMCKSTAARDGALGYEVETDAEWSGN
ncbi:hypothetical protein B0H11DRAFT_1917567 [Mycena galericulata]|nr:hypothetical protein B0H11DRAFT_1917567 [Mycena galericulata]